MPWPRDPNCPKQVTSCDVLGHIFTGVDVRCVICDTDPTTNPL